MRGLSEGGLQGKEQGMNVRITASAYETEFDIPEKKLELVRALLMELATAAQNAPK